MTCRCCNKEFDPAGRKVATCDECFNATFDSIFSDDETTLKTFQGARDGSQGRDGSEPAP